MKYFIKILSVYFVVIVLLGCANPYYGYSEKEWYHFSESERTEIKKEYEMIIHSRLEQNHKDTIDARTESIINRGVNQ